MGVWNGKNVSASIYMCSMRWTNISIWSLHHWFVVLVQLRVECDDTHREDSLPSVSICVNIIRDMMYAFGVWIGTATPRQGQYTPLQHVFEGKYTFHMPTPTEADALFLQMPYYAKGNTHACISCVVDAPKWISAEENSITKDLWQLAVELTAVSPGQRPAIAQALLNTMFECDTGNTVKSLGACFSAVQALLQRV